VSRLSTIRRHKSPVTESNSVPAANQQPAGQQQQPGTAAAFSRTATSLATAQTQSVASSSAGSERPNASAGQPADASRLGVDDTGVGAATSALCAPLALVGATTNQPIDLSSIAAISQQQQQQSQPAIVTVTSSSPCPQPSDLSNVSPAAGQQQQPDGGVGKPADSLVVLSQLQRAATETRLAAGQPASAASSRRSSIRSSGSITALNWLVAAGGQRDQDERPRRTILRKRLETGHRLTVDDSLEPDAQPAADKDDQQAAADRQDEQTGPDAGAVSSECRPPAQTVANTTNTLDGEYTRAAAEKARRRCLGRLGGTCAPPVNRNRLLLSSQGEQQQQRL
jgi:hypothetical protein